jgi:thiamine-phosphate pyrophosphorylase
MRPIADCTLYGILDLGYVTAADAPRTLEAMLEGGVDCVQLRAKRTPLPEIAALARILQPIATAAGAPFILNDHPALAGELAIDGVHVGQDDLPVSQARTLAKTHLIGRSTHSLAQATATAGPDTPAAERPNYIGFGPLFATPTKPDYRPIGTDEIRRVHQLVTVPIFCIGGIKRENLEAVLDAGARRVVIVSGILQAPDIAAYCRDVKARLNQSR